jgi:hypothetical protein
MAKATSDGIQLKVKGWVDYTRLYHCQDIVIRALIRWIKEESKSLENVTFENGVQVATRGWKRQENRFFSSASC